MNQLIAQNASKYAAQEADSYVKGTREDPFAFDYDHHYDIQKAQEQKMIQNREAQFLQNDKQRPQSKYVNKLKIANERREVEKSAAWERIEAKNNLKEGKGVNQDSFVTSSYLKQLEIQKEGQIITAVEEELNKNKTANSQTGMSGFSKYLGKLRGIEENQEL